MLLHDILEETVYDIQTMEDEAVAEDIAWHMQQAPSIANLVKRLQEMEVREQTSPYHINLHFESFFKVQYLPMRTLLHK